MTERSPDPALEERVVSTLITSGDIRPRRSWQWPAAGVALAAALALVLLHPWSPAQRGNQEYVLLLYNPATYQWPPPGHLPERRAEYARWADSLYRLGEMTSVAGRLEGPETPNEVGGLFIIRANSQAQADSIAASSPHARYGGRTEVRRFIE